MLTAEKIAELRAKAKQAIFIMHVESQTMRELLDEIEALRAANTKLHRRAQIAEAFVQSCDDHPAAWLRQLRDRWPRENGIIRSLIEDITKAKEKAARRALSSPEGTK